MRDQIADIEGLLNGLQSQQDNTYRPPPTKLPGEYLEWIYGPFAKDIGLPGVETDFVEARGGMFHVSEPYPEPWDKYSYSRNDTASYVVVLRTYAEHETSKGVIKIAGGVAGPPTLLRSTEVSVVVTVVSRKSGAILARWDAPTPGEWEEGGGQVNFNKLLSLKNSLATYELREAKWPLRQDAR